MRPNRFGKFALVGCLGTTVQLVTMSVLSKALHMPIVPATLLSVELALLHNFWWHQKYTWAERQAADCLQRLWRFHLANGVVSLLGNGALSYLFVTRLRMPGIAATLAAIALCAFANFALAERWIYQDDRA